MGRGGWRAVGPSTAPAPPSGPSGDCTDSLPPPPAPVPPPAPLPPRPRRSRTRPLDHLGLPPERVPGPRPIPALPCPAPGPTAHHGLQQTPPPSRPRPSKAPPPGPRGLLQKLPRPRPRPCPWPHQGLRHRLLPSPRPRPSPHRPHTQAPPRAHLGLHHGLLAPPLPRPPPSPSPGPALSCPLLLPSRPTWDCCTKDSRPAQLLPQQLQRGPVSLQGPARPGAAEEPPAQPQGYRQRPWSWTAWEWGWGESRWSHRVTPQPPTVLPLGLRLPRQSPPRPGPCSSSAPGTRAGTAALPRRGPQLPRRSWFLPLLGWGHRDGGDGDSHVWGVKAGPGGARVGRGVWQGWREGSGRAGGVGSGGSRGLAGPWCAGV